MRRLPNVGRNMLIIDDDDVIASSGPHFFPPDAWNVEVVRDLAEAAFRLREGSFDVILVDVALTGSPIAAGIDLVAAARLLQPHAVIVVISAFGSPGVVAETARLGADGFLHKPVSFGDINAGIQTLFRENDERGYSQTV